MSPLSIQVTKPARKLQVLLDASFGLDVHIQLISRVCGISLLHICPSSSIPTSTDLVQPLYLFLPRLL